MTDSDAGIADGKRARRDELERTIALRTRQVRRTFLSAIDSLVRALEARHPDTCGHSLRVRSHALRLARALGWDRRRRRQLALAAQLHDIGKVGVAEGVLCKAGPLTDAERRAVEAHAATGERVLAPVVRSRRVLAAVRGHHERYDGGGYPDGLVGEAVPPMARVIALADCYDALTSRRAYRGPLPWTEALEIIRAGAGTQFDPALVPVFLEVMSRQ
jgi:HD-GYP domain-containing protein (c-di-GMP phosphodiesterase class II)